MGPAIIPPVLFGLSVLASIGLGLIAKKIY